MLELQFVVNGEHQVVSLDLDETRFGRSGENEVVLPDYSVSRRHARIVREGDRWWAEDLKSTNGVQLNGQSVQRAEIQAGDGLKIGVFEMQVTGDAPGAVPGDGPIDASTNRWRARPRLRPIPACRLRRRVRPACLREWTGGRPRRRHSPASRRISNATIVRSLRTSPPTTASTARRGRDSSACARASARRSTRPTQPSLRLPDAAGADC